MQELNTTAFDADYCGLMKPFQVMPKIDFAGY
jgi:hypothetical protein